MPSSQNVRHQSSSSLANGFDISIPSSNCMVIVINRALTWTIVAAFRNIRIRSNASPIHIIFSFRIIFTFLCRHILAASIGKFFTNNWHKRYWFDAVFPAFQAFCANKIRMKSVGPSSVEISIFILSNGISSVTIAPISIQSASDLQAFLGFCIWEINWRCGGSSSVFQSSSSSSSVRIFDDAGSFSAVRSFAHVVADSIRACSSLIFIHNFYVFQQKKR